MKNVVNVQQVVKIIFQEVSAVLTVLVFINLFRGLDFLPMENISTVGNILTVISFLWKK